jgi:hypothetical protein
MDLKKPCLNLMPARSFYSLRPGGLIETRGPIVSPEVVETLYNIYDLNG